jgi:hypothetical protein
MYDKKYLTVLNSIKVLNTNNVNNIHRDYLF